MPSRESTAQFNGCGETKTRLCVARRGIVAQNGDLMRYAAATITVMFSLLMLLPLASAQNPNLIPPGNDVAGCNFVTGKMSFECVPNYIAFLIKLVFGFIGGFTLTEIIYSGYQIALAGLQGGDVSGPRKRIVSALMGLAVSVFAFLIVDTVIYALTR